MNSNAEQIERELAAVDETVHEDTTEVGWPAPLLSLSKTTTVGEYTETVRIEVQDGGWGKNTGDLAVLGDAFVQALTDAARPPVTQLRVSPMPDGLAAAIKKTLLDRPRAAEEPKPTQEQLEEALAEAEYDAAECSRQHGDRLAELRRLVEKARRDELRRLVEQAAGEAAAGGAGAAQDAGDQPYDNGGALPPSGDLGDAVQTDLGGGFMLPAAKARESFEQDGGNS